jgi:small conductance mechanosensitive channel
LLVPRTAGAAPPSPDTVIALVDNGKVFGQIIQNFSALPVRRVDRTAQLSGPWAP